MFNDQFWADHFRTNFAPNLSRLLDVLEDRLLPTFSAIDKEADKVATAEWERRMHLPVHPDQDPSVFAEQAFDAGLSHYMAMIEVRQSLLNVYAPALYHAWEQQLLEFFRRSVLRSSERSDHRLFSLPATKQRLKDAGIDLALFPTWSAIEELRLLANAVKHADGTSANRLKRKRPDLFQNPSLMDFGLPHFGQPSVYAPLSGDGIFVTLEALRAYCSALVRFWGEFSDALRHAHR